MCATCGCDGGTVSEGHGRPHAHPHELGHEHSHEHGHEHSHGGQPGSGVTTVTLEQEVLAKNDHLAQHNRAWLDAAGSCAVNLMSSPGAGKTTLLERTVRALDGSLPVSVVEGDQETPVDAERIRAAGCRAVQINTGSGCHLDAPMLAGALERLAPQSGSLVFVENVGNLVCPALFDLGERARVVIMSTTEGEDKPLKYPHMFRSADLVVLNKSDLLPYLDFELDRLLANIRRTNPGVPTLCLSARTGEGLDDWYGWLRSTVSAPSAHPRPQPAPG